LTNARGAGALVGNDGSPVRLVRVEINLDLRQQKRGVSSVEYELVNTDVNAPWEDELVFVSTASTVTVTLDHVVIPARSLGVPWRPELAFEERLEGAYQGQSFRVRLGPGERRHLCVTFDCEPAEAHYDDTGRIYTDGLWREFTRDVRPRLVSKRFVYPLWPAYGFGGGVGPMRVTVLTDPGATAPAPPSGHRWQYHPGKPEQWFIELPEAVSVEAAPLREVVVDYPTEMQRQVYAGASVFAAARFASNNEPLLRPHLEVSADLVVAGVGGFSLGASTAFSKSTTFSTTYQRGLTSPYGSYYIGGGGLVTYAGSASPGMELRVGGRLLVVPLDLSVQVHPWAEKSRGDIAALRVLVGFRIGL
jgi:hypothetical protein